MPTLHFAAGAERRTPGKVDVTQRQRTLSGRSRGGRVRIGRSREPDDLDDLVRFDQIPLDVRTAGAGGPLRRVLKRVTDVEGCRNFPRGGRRSLHSDFTDGKRAGGEGRKVLAQLLGDEGLFFRPITVVVNLVSEARQHLSGIILFHVAVDRFYKGFNFTLDSCKPIGSFGSGRLGDSRRRVGLRRLGGWRGCRSSLDGTLGVVLEEHFFK